MSMLDKDNEPNRLRQATICGAVVATIGIGTLGYKFIETKNELNETYKELIASLEINNEISNELIGLNDELSSLKYTLDNYKYENTELGEAVRLLESENSQLQEENISLGKNIAVLRTDVESLEAARTSGNVNISQADINLLAQLVFDEGNTEPRAGQLGIVHVVLNRLNDDRFPNTVQEVVFQPSQFSGAWRLNTHPVLDEHVAIVNEAINGSDNTGGALFFVNHAIACPVAGGWHHTRNHTITIGQHTFRK